MEIPPYTNITFTALSTYFHRLRKRQPRSYEIGRISDIFNGLLATPCPYVFLDTTRRETEMARRFVGKTFATLSLTSDDEKRFTEWLSKEKLTGITACRLLIEAGYKLSITWVTESNAFCLSVIGTDDMKLNADAIMTSWSDDLDEVACIAAYKHFVLCDGGAWPTNANGQRWG